MQEVRGKGRLHYGRRERHRTGNRRRICRRGNARCPGRLAPGPHRQSALAEFRRLGHSQSVHAIALDVTDRAAMSAAAAETERVFGGVHVLVNNAGVGIQGPFKGITYADWDFGLGVNLGGVINGLQTFLPRIRAHGQGGHIVSTASLAALVPMPSQFVIYQAAKAAVVTISECIRAELGRENIGVTVLCPGPVRTNIHELSRNRPAHFGIGDAFREHEDSGAAQVSFPSAMEPSAVGALILAQPSCTTSCMSLPTANGDRPPKLGTLP